MNTYFARHTEKLDIDSPTRAELRNRCRIGIHFPDTRGQLLETDNTSLDPEDYVGPARKAIRALNELSRDGGYVYAEFFSYEDALVGFIEPGTPVALFRGTWGNRTNRSGRQAVIKTLPLGRWQTVSPAQYAVISVARPRQGTLMKWRCVGKAIEDMVEGRMGERSLRDLFPSEQEIMCSEFLRTPDSAALGLPKLARLVLPVGRTMRDIDIAALADDGSRIYGQVTYRSREESDQKVQRLKVYAAEGCHLVLFCQCDEPVVRDSIHEIPLSLVYDSFRSGPLGEAWLRMARGLP